MAEILKLSFQDQIELADEYDKKKLAMEAALVLALNKIWRSMSKDFEAVYADTGQVIDFEEYESDIKSELKKSYRRSTDYFSKHFVRGLKKQSEEQTGDEKERSLLLLFIRSLAAIAISKQLTDYITNHSTIQSKRIMKTTKDIFEKNISKAVTDLEEEGIEVNNQTVAKESANTSKNENINRSGGIAETEVGNSSGTAMDIEAEEFEKEIIKETQEPITIKKNWITRMDEAVRTAHMVAHGQKRNIKQAFDVGGEQLKFPGDTSLGASLGNIIRCRCLSVNT